MHKVVANDLAKFYGKVGAQVQALKELSFSVEEGEIFGIIGPDGAGKTSLFRILTSLLLPDAGTAYVNGHDVVKEFREIRKEVGYMPGKFSLYQDLTVAENLEFFATLFNTSVKQNYDLIKDIYEQIAPFKNRKAGALSGGMKQKLALSCALIHRPVVLFLDEPTTGVDAVSRKEFWQMLRGLKKQGITILVSTPYMDEAALCDRVGLIQNGSWLQVDAPDKIVEEYPFPLLAAKSSSMLQLLNTIRESPGVRNVYPFGEFHHVVVENDANVSRLENEWNSKMGESVVVQTTKPDIEDCFIAFMQREKEAVNHD